MNYKLIKLFFTSPLHIHGERSDYADSYRHVHSDTIHAAILQTWAVLGKTEWLEKYNQGHFDFVCSSLFPFTTQEKEAIYFFPRPIKPFNADAVKEFDNNSNVKVLKKIQWLDSLYYVEHLSDVNGCSPVYSDIIDEKYLTKFGQKLQPFIKTQTEAKVSIPRNSRQDSNPYNFERIIFAEKSGLFFLVDASEEVFSKIISALNLLQHEGIGSDRNLGNGQFCYQIADVNELGLASVWNMESIYRTNLSLYLPKGKEELENQVSDKEVAYELIKRGGWISTEPFLNLKKQSIYMFREGGVFKCNSNILGGKTNLFPSHSFGINHPVHRSGKSLFIPIAF